MRERDWDLRALGARMGGKWGLERVKGSGVREFPGAPWRGGMRRITRFFFRISLNVRIVSN